MTEPKMTETTPTNGGIDRRTTDETMRDVDHVHPHEDPSIGQSFRRGPVLIADGGSRRSDRGSARTESGEYTDRSTAVSDRAPAEDDEIPMEGDSPATMADVDHVPPHGRGANQVFERGNEHSFDGDVGSEESREDV